MRPETDFEEQSRRCLIVRRVLLAVGLLCIAAGFRCMAVAPDVAWETAIWRSFTGLGLLLAGLFFALLSRLLT